MILFGLFLLLFFAEKNVEGLNYWVEDAYFEELDPEYVDAEASNVEVVWPDDNTSGLAINFTLIKDFPKNINAHLNLYLKSMGEYKTHSGISVDRPWCVAVKDPVVVMSLVKAIGMAEDNCPPKAGFYGTEFWAPSTEFMPDYLPGVDYRIAFAIVQKKKILLAVSVLVSLS